MYDEELNVALAAAKEAGNIIKRTYGTALAEQEKENWHEIVTRADKEANSIILSSIQEAFPEHQIFSEESRQKKKDSQHVWYIDPLDGTTNFVTQFPFFCTALGLLHNGKPAVTVIYNPLAEEIFTAAHGKGAVLNEKPIQVSKNDDIKKTLITFCCKNLRSDAERLVPAWPQLKEMGRDLRQPGAGNLEIGYVAVGRNDAYFSSSKIYDIAPSLCLAREAGCKITDWKGGPWKMDSGILITNGTKIHEDLVNVLSKL